MTSYSLLSPTRKQSKMNICVNSLYRLSTPQFHSLYSEDVSDEALALLIGEVENGNQNCIDLLCILRYATMTWDIKLRNYFLISLAEKDRDHQI